MIGADYIDLEHKQTRANRLWSALMCRTAICGAISVGLASTFSPRPAKADPTGGVVVGGQATISQSGTHTQINQGSQTAIINWQTFGIQSGESVNFAQPNSNSLAINKVQTNVPSEIAGSLTANGNVWIENRSGVFIRQSAQVNVGGIMATTARIDTSGLDTNQGVQAVTASDAAAGSVVSNEGNVQSDGGAIVLVAPVVENAGTLQANGSDVALGAGSGFTVDFDGDGLTKFEVAPGNGVKLTNTGNISAQGGAAYISASSAEAVQGSVVSIGGTVEATRIEERGGVIVISGGNTGVTEVTGTLDASQNQGDGGQVVVTGEKVDIASTARIDVSGAANGGKAEIGGAYQGAAIVVPKVTASAAPVASPLPPAKRTRVQQGAQITANAGAEGDGGTVIVWSDEATGYYGNIEARGGFLVGDGGFAEVSGKFFLEYQGDADLGAFNGLNGTLLLDPLNIVIEANNGGGNNVNNVLFDDPPAAGTTTIASGALGRDSDNVILEATNDITIEGSVVKTDGGLTLSAGNDVIFNAGVTIELQTNSALNITADADFSAGGGAASDGTGTITFTDSVSGIVSIGDIVLSSGQNSGIALGTIDQNGVGAVTINSNGGAVTQVTGATVTTLANSTTTVNAGAGNITLTNAGNDFAANGANGHLSFTGAAVSITDANAIDVTGTATSLTLTTGANGAATLGNGTTGITVTGGNLTVNAEGNVNVVNDIATATSGNVVLNADTNTSGDENIDITGGTSITAIGDLTFTTGGAGTLLSDEAAVTTTLTTGGTLTMPATSIAGSLTLDVVDLSPSASIQVDGTTTVTASGTATIASVNTSDLVLNLGGDAVFGSGNTITNTTINKTGAQILILNQAAGTSVNSDVEFSAAQSFTTFTATAEAGGVQLNAGGDLTGLGAASFTTTNNGPVVLNGATTLAGVTINSDGIVVFNDGDLTLASLNVTASDSISQDVNGNLLIAGATSLTSAGTITLSNAGNDFDNDDSGDTLAISAAGQTVSIADTDNLAFGAVTAGTLNVSSGDVSIGAAMAVTNAATFTNTSGGAVNVGAALDILGYELTDTDLGNITAGSVAIVSTDQQVTIDSVTNLTEALSVTAGTGDVIVSGANSGLGNVTVVSAANFGPTLLTDTFDLGSNTIDVTASDDITVSNITAAVGTFQPGDDVFIQGVNSFTTSITIDSGADPITVFGTPVNANGTTEVQFTLATLTTPSLTFATTGAITVNTGTLAATTTNLNSTGAGAVVVDGLTAQSLVVGAGNTGTVDFNNNASTINADLSVLGASAIGQDAAVNVTGATSLVASVNILMDVASDLGTTVNASTTGDVTLTDSGALVLGDIDANNFTATGVGISDNGDGVVDEGAGNDINVSGTTSLSAAGQTIELNDLSNVFGTDIDATAQDMTIVSPSAVALGAVSVTGNMTIQAGGSITDTAGDQIQVDGNTSLLASDGATTFFAIVLDNNSVSGGANVDIHDFDFGNDGGDVIATGQNIQINDIDAVSLGAITTNNSGVLVVNAGGTVTQNGAMSVAGTVSVTAEDSLNAGEFSDIILSNATNSVAGVISLVGEDIQLSGGTYSLDVITANDDATADSALAISGTDGSFALTSTGNVTDNGAGGVSVAGVLSINTTGADVILDDDGTNTVPRLEVTAANNVTLNTEGGLILQTVIGSSGSPLTSLTLDAENSITQTIEIFTGGLTLTAQADGAADQFDILLNDEQNSITGDISVLAAEDVTLTNANAQAAAGQAGTFLGAITTTDNSGGTQDTTINNGNNGDLIVTSRAGGITDNGTLTIAGDASFIGSNLAGTTFFDVLLDDAAVHSFGTLAVTGGDVTLNVPGAFDIAGQIALNTNTDDLINGTNTGDLDIRAGGTVTQSAALSLTGTLSVTAESGGDHFDVLLNDATNSISGTIAITGEDISLANNTATTIGTITATDNSAGTPDGTIALTTGAANDGDFVLNVLTGGVTQAGSTTVTVPGQTSITATGQSVSLDQATNDFGDEVDATVGNLTLQDVGDINLDTISTSNLTVTANNAGNINDVDIDAASNISLTGTTSLSAGNQIDIAETGHNFDGAVVLNAQQVTNFRTSGNLQLNTVAATNSGDVLNTITSGGTIVIAGDVSVAGNSDLTMNAAGEISQQTNEIITADVLTLAPGTGNAINLTEANAVNTLNVTDGGVVQFTDTDALALGAVGATSLVVTTGDAITDVTGSQIVVTGATSLNANSGTSDITLDNNSVSGGANVDIHDFAAASAFTASGNNIQVNDINAIQLGVTNAGGNLIVNAGSTVTQSGALSVTGTTSITASDSLVANAFSDIVLDQTANSLSGEVSLSGEDIQLASSNALTIGAITAQADAVTALDGTASIAGSGVLLAGTGGVVDSASGGISVVGALSIAAGSGDVILDQNNVHTVPALEIASAGTVTLNTEGALVLQNQIASSGTPLTALNLDAEGTITQTVDIFTGSLSVVAEADGGDRFDIELNRSGNSITGTIAITGEDIDLANTGATQLTSITATDNTAGTPDGTIAAADNDGDFFLTATGAVSQPSGTITVPGQTSITATGQTVSLTQATNDFGDEIDIAALSLDLQDVGDINLDQVTLTGNLTLTANNAGNINDVDVVANSAISVGGTTSLNAGDSINIDEAGTHTFTGLTTIQADDIAAFRANSALQFAAVTTTNGGGVTNTIDSDGSTVTFTEAVSIGAGADNLTVQANGAVSQNSNGTINANVLTVDPTGNAVTLTLDNTVTTLNVDNGGNVDFTDANTIILGDIRGDTSGVVGVTSLDIIAGGAAQGTAGSNIIDAGTTAVVVAGSTSLLATGAITLNNLSGADPTHDFDSDDSGDAVNAQGGNITLFDRDNLRVGTVTATAAAGNVTLQAGSANLTGFSVIDSGVITAPGTLTASTEGGVIDLDNSNHVVAVFVANTDLANNDAPANVFFNNTGTTDLEIGNIEAAQLGITANGAITQSGGAAILSNDTTTITSATNGTITLVNAGNDFTDEVNSGVTTPTASFIGGEIQIVDADSIELGTITVGGTGTGFTVTAQDVSLANATVNVGSTGTVTANNSANDQLSFGDALNDGAANTTFEITDAGVAALTSGTVGTVALNTGAGPILVPGATLGANLITDSGTGATTFTTAASAITGDLTITSGSTVSQDASGNVSVTGITSISATGQTVLLGNAGNNFDSDGGASPTAEDVVNVSAQNVTLSDADTIRLGEVVATGNLTVTAIGNNIIDNGTNGVGDADGNDIQVTGTTSLSATGDITLDDTTNDFNELDMAAVNATIVDDDDIALGTISATTLTVTAGGAISDTGTEAVVVTGATSLTAQDGGTLFDITLDNADLHDFSSTAAFNATGQNVTVDENTSISLGAVSVTGGDLTVIANENVLDDDATGAISVTGNVTLDAGFDVDIDRANAHTISGIVTLAGDDIFFRASETAAGNNLTFGNVTADGGANAGGVFGADGDIELIVDQGVMQLNGAISTPAAGDTTLTASNTIDQAGGSIVTDVLTVGPGAGQTATLTQTANDANTLEVVNGSVNFRDADDLILGLSTAEDLTVRTGGNITDAGQAVSVTGTTSLNANAGASDIILDDIDLHDFADSGAGDFDALAQNITIDDLDGLNLGDVTANGTLTVNTNGALVQSTGSGISVAGISSLTAVGADITLDNAGNNFDSTGAQSGHIDASAVSISVRDTNDIILGAIVATGDLTVQAANIFDNGASGVGDADGADIQVTGVTSLSATGDIVLDDTLNDFDLAGAGTGEVDATATNVTIVDDDDITLGAISASNMTITAGAAINDNNGDLTDAIAVSGNTSLLAQDGLTDFDILLDNQNGGVNVHDFADGGANTVTATGQNIALLDSDGLQLGNITASGTFRAETETTQANADLTQAGGTSVLVNGNSTLSALGAGSNIILSNTTNNFDADAGAAADAVADVDALTGGNLTLYDADGLALGTVQANNATITAEGSVTDTVGEAIVITGTTSILAVDAGDFFDIRLDNDDAVANDLLHNFNIVTLQGEDIQIEDVDNITLQNVGTVANAAGATNDPTLATVLGGDINVVSGGDVVTDALVVDGNVRLESQGSQTIVSITANSFTVDAGQAIDLGTITTTDTINVTAAGNITFDALESTAGSIELTADDGDPNTREDFVLGNNALPLLAAGNIFLRAPSGSFLNGQLASGKTFRTTGGNIHLDFGRGFTIEGTADGAFVLDIPAGTLPAPGAGAVPNVAVIEIDDGVFAVGNNAFLQAAEQPGFNPFVNLIAPTTPDAELFRVTGSLALVSGGAMTVHIQNTSNVPNTGAGTVVEGLTFLGGSFPAISLFGSFNGESGDLSSLGGFDQANLINGLGFGFGGFTVNSDNTANGCVILVPSSCQPIGSLTLQLSFNDGQLLGVTFVDPTEDEDDPFTNRGDEEEWE